VVIRHHEKLFTGLSILVAKNIGYIVCLTILVRFIILMKKGLLVPLYGHIAFPFDFYINCFNFLNTVSPKKKRPVSTGTDLFFSKLKMTASQKVQIW